MLLYYVIFGLICIPVFCIDTEVVVLRAVRGHDARLPCGQGKVFLDGPDAYVLWLKNEREFLYRFPNEETQRRSLSLDQVFGTTCIAGACHDDTSLLLKRVSDRDGGIYRCRVHYQASPSVDYVIDMRLVDSPGTPQIYNDAGEPLKRGHIQHISLETNFTLTCEVADEPDTLLFWRRNGIVIERAEASRPRTLRATVSVTNATRAELDAHYECLAQNADVTEPLSASVLVTMYLPPLSVEIRLNNNVDFEAGQPRVVDCVVVGCVPPPSITWHLGDTLLRPSVHKELHDGNYTVSSLTLAPSLRDGGRELACRAHNSHLPGQVFQDQVTLNVGYRPVCLSSGEETIGAVPGEAETVTCVVEASPEPLQFSWTFADSRTLYTSVKVVSRPVSLSSGEETIGVVPGEAETVTCVVEASPEPLQFSWTFADSRTLYTSVKVVSRPVSLSSGEETIGVVPGEAETVTCVVEASPEPLQFSWTFADSRTLYTSVKKLPGHQHRYSSTLTWLPRVGDYGALLCRATNSFGEQKRACAYAVARGGAPRAPQCVVKEVGTLRIQCKKDWDGGRPQTVHLIVRDSTGTVVNNASDAAGHFQLASAGHNLSAVVYASNSRGRSEEVELQMQNTPMSAFAVTEPTPVRGWARWLEVSAIVVVATVAIAATTLCVRAVRARRHTDNPDLVPRADGTFHREPDFAGGERVLGTTNITVNQLASCQNQYSSSPVPSCRVLVGCPHPPPDACPATQHSYYV